MKKVNRKGICLWCHSEFEVRPLRKYCCPEHGMIYRQIKLRIMNLYPFNSDAELDKLERLGQDYRFKDESLNRFYGLGEKNAN